MAEQAPPLDQRSHPYKSNQSVAHSQTEGTFELRSKDKERGSRVKNLNETICKLKFKIRKWDIADSNS